MDRLVRVSKQRLEDANDQFVQHLYAVEFSINWGKNWKRYWDCFYNTYEEAIKYMEMKFSTYKVMPAVI